MVDASWSSIRIRPSPSLGFVEAELLGSDQSVMGIAEVARVTVVVAATLSERLDVVDLVCGPRDACRQAHLAKPIGALQSALTLALTSTAAQAFNHYRPL